MEKVLQPVKNPASKDLLPGTIPAHHEWVATLLTVFVQGYNTNLIKKEDLPKTFQDLLNPKRKGKLGIETEDFDWFAATMMELGAAKGTALFRDIVSTNGISVRRTYPIDQPGRCWEVSLALTV